MPAAGKKYSNFNGELVKIGIGEGAYTIPSNRFIAAESYKAMAYMQDLDPWTDANGYEHRNAVKLKALKVEFETPAMLTDDELSEFLFNIDRNITNADANECYITAFVQRYNRYFTQKGYLADIEPQIYGNYERNSKGVMVLRYDPVRFAFVGGVYDG